MQTAALAGICAFFLGAADQPKDSVASEQMKFEGSWKVVKAASDGMEASNKELEELGFTFKGDEFLEPKRKDKWQKYVINVDAKPFKIDIGEAKGIYRFADADTLEISWRKNNGERPTEFKAPNPSKIVVFIMKREKK